MGALVVLGQLITGTGLEYVLVNAYLDIVSLKTALYDVSSIKKARYSLLVLACCLHQVLACCLPVTNPNLYRVFRVGKFAVQSTCTGFSKMAFDQALIKQNNKTIKATNGYINVVNQDNKKKFLRIIKYGKPYKSKRPNFLTCY